MSENFIKGIVQILEGQRIAGTGFLVSSDGLIVTCAYVFGTSMPKKVMVIFQTDDEPREAILIPEWWRGIDAEDVAFLQVQGDLPKGVESLSLGSSSGTEGLHIQTFGYPHDNEVVGERGSGEVIGFGSFTVTRQPLLQLSSYEITKGFSGAPIWSDTQRRVIGMVVFAVAVDELGRRGKTAYAISTETIRDICPLLHISDVCPYRGLEAFTEHDYEYFFGRERAVEKLLANFKSSPHFLAVLGPSGSGKSSLVQAGLMRRLHKGTWLGSGERLELIISRPANDPFAELASQGLTGRSTNLTERVQAWKTNNPDKERLVLIIDQFEEVWTNCSREVALDFIQQFVALIHASRSAQYTTIILVMRDDFYSRLGQHEALADLVDQSLVRITRTLRRSEITAIIQEPARAVGLQFAPGLIDTIVEDVFSINATRVDDELTADSTILPLLEFALTQLWKLRQDGELTHDAYNNIERVSGGLTLWADNAFYSLEEKLRPLAHSIFMHLIHVGDESQNIPDSRRRRTLTSLLSKQSQPDDIHIVISHLAKSRLLVTGRNLTDGQESVEIIHDVLLREWRRLNDWIAQNRSFLAWHQDFEKRVQVWIESDLHDSFLRDKGRLLYGRDLDQAMQWLEERAADLDPVEQDFIRASQEQAEHDHQTAIARQLVTQAELIRIQQPDLVYRSVILVAEAMRRVPSVEADQALRSAIALIPHPIADLNHQKMVKSLAFSLDGHYIATSSEDCTVVVWEMPQATSIASLTHQGAVNALAFSPDGHLLITATSDHTIGVWEVGRWRQIAHFTHQGAVNALAFSPDGQYLATASEDHTAGIWKIASRRRLADLKHEGGVNAVAFSPDGQYLATASSDYSASIWKVATGQQLAKLQHRMRVLSVAFSPDGQSLVTASADSTAGIWEVPSGQQLQSLQHEWMVGSVIFSPDGRYLVTTGGDKFARIWEMPEGRLLTRIPHHGNTKFAAFSSDGRYLATAGDTMISASEVGNWRQIVCLIRGYALHTVIFSPDGHYVAAAGEGSTAYIWEVTDQPSLASLTCPKVKAFAFTRDSQNLMTAGDTIATRWDLARRKLLSRFPFRSFPLGGGMKFSPDGKLLAVMNGGLWDTESSQESDVSMGQTIAFNADGSAVATNIERGEVVVVGTDVERSRFLQHKDAVDIIVFSPDGRYLATACDRPSGSGWNGKSPVVIWELPQGSPLVSLPQEEYVDQVLFSPHGSYLAVVSNDGVMVWETSTRSLLVHVERESSYDSIRDIAFSPDEQYLALANSHQIQLYDTTKKQLLDPLEDMIVTRIIFSPNGRYLASASDDNHACVWDVASGYRLAYLGHQQWVKGIAFSPDSHYLATASWDTTVCIWETMTGLQLSRFTHTTKVTDVSFSPDGKYVTSLNWDDTLQVWLWRPEDMIEEARAHVPRNLTQQEWQMYLGNEPYRKLYPDLL